MASNFYTSKDRHGPPRYEQLPPTPPFDRGRSFANRPTYGYGAHPDSRQNPYAQSSFGDESITYLTGGRVDNGDEYSENIPLKANADIALEAPPPPRKDWEQDTGYPPPPGPQRLPRPPNSAHRKGWRRFFGRKTPWLTYLLTTIQISVFIVELVKNAQLTGTPIEIHPSFNPMIGPSPYVQINMGARFDPCMKNIEGVQNAQLAIYWPCPNTTTTNSNAATNQCTLSELCGFGGVPNPRPGGSVNDRPEPNQWFRFIIPMFLHAGFIHIGFNMLIQLTMAADIERLVGSWRFAIVYPASAIFGFVLGGNYAGPGEAVTGCSGALFGIFALYVLDMLYTWKQRPSPWKEFIIIVIGVGISFLLGMLPGLDNFSHIGGFIMGLALGLSIMRSPSALRRQAALSTDPYVTMSGGIGAAPQEEDRRHVVKQSGSSISELRAVNFFVGRKLLWWAWWLVRVGALVAVLIGFILLFVDFYKYPKSPCSWCYRLSCLPINNWCQQGQLKFTTTTT